MVKNLHLKKSFKVISLVYRERIKYWTDREQVFEEALQRVFEVKPSQ